MPKDHADKSQDITPIGLGGSIRPRSFLDVVSIVENYFIAEKAVTDCRIICLPSKERSWYQKSALRGRP